MTTLARRGWWTSVAMAAALALMPLGLAGASTDASGTWSSVGTLKAGTSQQTATLLPSGQVLVAGGVSCSGSTCTVLKTAQLYNPTTKAWAATGSMLSPRFDHTATLLNSGPLSGTVLVAGGCSTAIGGNCGTSLSSAEIYTPKTGKWTATGTMTIDRYGHTATLFLGGPLKGQVLVAGGFSITSGSNLSSAELFNPATGKWTATGSMTSQRSFHTATLLITGNVLAAGGYGLNGTSNSSSEVYNPTTGTWTASGTMSTPRIYHTATLLTVGTLKGDVLVAGGAYCVDYVCPPVNTAELYNPGTGAWTATGNLSVPRYDHTATLLTTGSHVGNVLVAGGASNFPGTALSSAELYNPSTGVWTATGAMHSARAAHTATLLKSGQVLAAGGTSSTNTNTALTSSEIYQP